MSLRRWIQALATVLSNSYWLFPFSGGIYTGPLKSFCLPGLNCYSCPAAVGACPLGAIQNFMAALRAGIQSGAPRPGFYVLGALGLTGTLAGRMPCAWLCPFGFLQELLYKIPAPRLTIPRWMTYLKYFFLALFVFILPFLLTDEFGYGITWFCQFICPAGTLEAGIPLLLLKPELRSLVGALFYNKIIILVAFVAAMVFVSRPFCRIACPLGAIYALFNKCSVFRMAHDADKCTRCGACHRDCPMGVEFYRGANQHDCIRCLKCLRHSCKYGAISYEIAGIADAGPPSLDPAGKAG